MSAQNYGPILTKFNQIEIQENPWLWPSRIPLGAITTLFGFGGEGRSFLACSFACAVSRGALLPDGSPAPSATQNSDSESLIPGSPHEARTFGTHLPSSPSPQASSPPTATIATFDESSPPSPPSPPTSNSQPLNYHPAFPPHRKHPRPFGEAA